MVHIQNVRDSFLDLTLCPGDVDIVDARWRDASLSASVFVHRFVSSWMLSIHYTSVCAGEYVCTVYLSGPIRRRAQSTGVCVAGPPSWCLWGTFIISTLCLRSRLVIKQSFQIEWVSEWVVSWRHIKGHSVPFRCYEQLKVDAQPSQWLSLICRLCSSLRAHVSLLYTKTALPGIGINSLWLDCLGPVLSRFYPCSRQFQRLVLSSSIRLCYKLSQLILHSPKCSHRRHRQYNKL